MRKICGRLSGFCHPRPLERSRSRNSDSPSCEPRFRHIARAIHGRGNSDDNGDFSRFAQLASHIKGVSSPVDSNVGLLTSAFQVSFDCAPRSFELSRLLTNIAGAGILAAPPMVEHTWDMMNPVGSLADTQEKIVDLVSRQTAIGIPQPLAQGRGAKKSCDTNNCTRKRNLATSPVSVWVSQSRPP